MFQRWEPPEGMTSEEKPCLSIEEKKKDARVRTAIEKISFQVRQRLE